ncbi:MAG: hypothetical protein KDE24_26510 [Caldilinea sp.]|nr:hypothetical protein [Caldilinea sp.]
MTGKKAGKPGKPNGRGKALPKMTQDIHVINGKRYVWVLGILSENHSHDEDCMFECPPARVPATGYPTRLPADTHIQTIRPNKPEPNEETQMWKQVKRDSQKRHARWRRQNREVFETSGLTYEDKGETLLFRNEGRPSCDFYLSTGRWKVNDGKGTMRRGGAKEFIAWYAKTAT